MRLHLATASVIAALACPSVAQEAEGDGFNLVEEGAQMILRGLLDEMDPAIDDLRRLAEELGPNLQLFADEIGANMGTILRTIDDIRYYEQPEILPNGDIVIRRSPDAPDWAPPKETPSPEIDL